MRILMISNAVTGHMNSMLGVGQWLKHLGHDVGWLGIPWAMPRMARLGFEIVEFGDASPTPEQAAGFVDFMPFVRDPERGRANEKMELVVRVPAQVETVRSILRRWRPDVVVLDPTVYAAVIGAAVEQVPYAAIGLTLDFATPPDIDRKLVCAQRLEPERSQLFESHGLTPDFRGFHAVSPHLNTVFSTPEYVDEEARLPPRTYLVGPSRALEARGDEVSFPWERLRRDRRIVYVSFGTHVSWRPDLFAKLAEATAPLDAQLVIAAGPGASGLDRLPGDAIVVEYAPQVQLLSSVSVMVTHGGANSIAEALTAGVPLLVDPVFGDQPANAHFIVKRGVGHQLTLGSATVPEIRQVLDAMLDPGCPCRAKIEPIRCSYQACNGSERAARLIHETWSR